tara:strand:+ start:8012 stop:8407 length:396 start_codon:yes stop_codon:yes gene_type:complete
MSAQDIFNKIKEGDNKVNWAIASELAEFRRKAKKMVQPGEVDFSDKKAVEQDLYEELRKAYKSGNVAGAKELARLLNIGEASQDIIIQPIDFKDAYNEENTTTTTEAEVLPDQQLESDGSGSEEPIDLMAP